jgi:hypothetical protein
MLYQKKCGDVKPYIVILTKVDSLLKISSLSANVKKNPSQNLFEEVAMKLKYKTESITLEDQALRDFLEGVDMELDMDGQQEKDNTVSQSMANCNNDSMESQTSTCQSKTIRGLKKHMIYRSQWSIPI